MGAMSIVELELAVPTYEYGACGEHVVLVTRLNLASRFSRIVHQDSAGQLALSTEMHHPRRSFEAHTIVVPNMELSSQNADEDAQAVASEDAAVD